MALLEVNGLQKTYGRRRVVNGVGFEVDRGEVVGLLGPNGAGKTTSFRMATGMIRPEAGSVRFDSKNVTNWPMFKRARLGLGYLSQETSVFRKLSVEKNILAILESMPQSRTLSRKLTGKERHKRTDEVLEQFGLTEVRRSTASTLSGGEKRRLEIARCLVCEPLLILLDEPFTGIDPITIQEIQKIIRELCDQGIGLLLTDHNVREALRITDRSYVITDGVVEAHGTPQEIIENPKVIQKYLGDSFSREHILLADAQAAARPRQETGTAVRDLLQFEQLHELVNKLLTPDRDSAETELLRMGRPALPVLLQAMERRDLEMRRLAFHVFQRILDGAGRFDAYAPEGQRRQQIEVLRTEFLRKAG